MLKAAGLLGIVLSLGMLGILKSQELKQRIAALKGVREEQVFIGNGSDEAIDLCYRIFCRPGVDNAVSIAPTYGMYRVAADINDVEMREVPLGADFSLPADALLAAADERTRLLWLCSPNNPTGNAFPAAGIERLLREFDGMVVLDEAYIDFAAGPGFLARLGEFGNLIVLQTLSKAWGMAGLRLGLAFASAPVAELFARVKYPYNINCLAQAAVAERLRTDYPALPLYPAAEGRMKLAAGWLIEQAGMKGHREGCVGVHDRQALVLVNYGGATGSEVLALAHKVQEAVRAKFGVEIAAEVNVL